ncbi:MAG: DUF4625 domain-containing protein [Chitinophagales bacterium]|nr:DUF4625 domain-containing protein [Chitinophagales bacterium]
MKHFNFGSLLALASLVFVLIACEKDGVDVTPPTMDITTFVPTPVAAEICGAEEPIVFHLTGGDQLFFDVIFNDDNALSQYKVDIHNNFDCHGHGGGSAPSVVVPNVENQTTDWTVLDIKELSGVSSPVNRTLDVPENVTAGNYHFHIQVIDEAGNDSPFASFYSIKIKNPLDDTPPQIIVKEPVDRSFSIKKGETIRFVGQVTDERSLSDGGNGVLYLAYTDLSTGNTFNTDESFAFDENFDQVFNFDFEYTVPQHLTTGSYRLSLGANDGVRNVAPFQFFEVEVTN